MSSDQYRQQVQRIQSDIARLQRDKAREADKLAQQNRKINSAQEQLSRASSPSSAASKSRDIARYRTEEAGIQKRIADMETKIAREQQRLNDAQKNLLREEAAESSRRQREQVRQANSQRREMTRISSTLDRHDDLHRQTLAALGRVMQAPESIVVLFLAANPFDQPELRLDEEVRSISEMIRKSEHRDSVKLVSWWAARPLDVLQALNEHRPHIVHFSGHGTDEDEIVLQDDAGQTRLVSKEAIVQTMALASSTVNLVFFNNCYSQAQAEEVVCHVPAAIGMTAAIDDQAARIFSAQFYSAIGFGLSVQEAFGQAKAALLLEGVGETDIPGLYVADGVDASQLILVKAP